MKKIGVNSLACKLLLLLLCCLPVAAWAQEGVFVPGFFDPARRMAKPDLAGLRLIRFLTEEDYPPFHFITPEGALTGFDIEIARAVCNELKLPCTNHTRRFGALSSSAMRSAIALLSRW